EEITVQENSRLVGLTLDACGFGREMGIIIVAIRRASGEMRFNPTFRTAIKAGDTLIALGETSKLKQLEEMLAVAR
ncbi:MAG TPA: TrkA C-terminal domain-containing protein, partial [Dissulfurispiraceae bacterium]